MRDIAGERALTVDGDRPRHIAGVIDDLDLTRSDDMEFKVAVADGEECFSITVEMRRRVSTAAEFRDLSVVERRKGNGLKVVFGHGLDPH